MTKLRLDETETHLSQMADDRSRWIVYTDDPVWVARLNKINASLICKTDFGFEYEIPDSWVKIKPPRKLSDKQRKALDKGRESKTT